MKALARFMDWPLRLKIAALLTVASFVPLVTVVLIDIQEMRQQVLVDATALLAARADQLVSELDGFHQTYQRAVDKLARLPTVVEFCQAVLAAADRPSPALLPILDVYHQTGDSNVRGVAILDSSGRVEVATEQALIGRDLSYRSDVQEALRGTAIISDVYLAGPEVNSTPTISYLAPVVGPERKLIGLAALWIRATALWDIAKTANELAGPRSFAVLFDHHGIRIAHTYSQEIVFHPGGRLDPTTIEALVAEHRFGEKTRRLLEDVRAFPEQFERARSASPDRELFRGFAPVNQTWNYGVARRFKTIPWTVFYMIPEASLKAPLTTLTWARVRLASVIILLALLAGTLTAAAILQPVRSLLRATELLAYGDLTVRVDGGASDELGRLARSFNSMAEQIEKRTARLRESEHELREKNSALEKANLAKDRFLASMSHELRTPLNAIIGFTGTLLMKLPGPLTVDQDKQLRTVQGSAKHLLSLINNILDLVKIESGKVELHLEPVACQGVIEEVVKTLRPLAEAKNLALTVRMPPEEIVLACDRRALSQILINLVNNAIKFTNQGEVRMELERRWDDEHLVTQIRIVDTGIGIQPEDQEKLFQAFSQVESSAARPYEGTGLGLYLSQRLAALLRGRLTFTSEYSKGSVFTVTFLERQDRSAGA